MIYIVYFINLFPIVYITPPPPSNLIHVHKNEWYKCYRPLKELLDMEWGSEVTDIGLHRWEDMTVPPRAAGDGEAPLTPRETAIQRRGSWGCVDLATERCVSIRLE